MHKTDLRNMTNRILLIFISFNEKLKLMKCLLCLANVVTCEIQTHLCRCTAAGAVLAAVMAVVEHQGFWVCRQDAATRGSAVSGYRPA